MMSPIANSIPSNRCHDRGHNRTEGLSRLRNTAASGEPQQNRAVGVRSNTTAAFDIRTAEGDRVTISIAAREQFSAYSRSGGGTQSAAVDSSSSSKVQVKIEGDLSEAEMKEITDLIGVLGRSVSTAQQTGTIDAEALSATLSGSSTLAGFAFAYRQQVTAGAAFSAVG